MSSRLKGDRAQGKITHALTCSDSYRSEILLVGIDVGVTGGDSAHNGFVSGLLERKERYRETEHTSDSKTFSIEYVLKIGLYAEDIIPGSEMEAHGITRAVGNPVSSDWPHLLANALFKVQGCRGPHSWCESLNRVEMQRIKVVVKGAVELSECHRDGAWFNDAT